MAKSRTAKKSKIKQQAENQVKAETINALTDLVSAYVKSWARTEAHRIVQTDPIPVIMPIKNGYQVGKHQVVKNHNLSWELHNYHGEAIEQFLDVRSAVAYSILYQLKRFKPAEAVLTADNRLSKLESDFQHYNRCMQTAGKRRDYATIDILAARYYDAQFLLPLAKEELEKTLRMNKYLKVWETGNHYETK
jgi:hypothetical protein